MRRLLAGAIVVAALAGCGGGGGHARRDAVNLYFDRVDRAQARLAARQPAIDKALAAFSVKGNSAAEVRALVRARLELDRARRAVAAITPPPDARALHRELVRLLARQAAVADEVVRMSSFMPRLQAVVQPLVPAAATLTRDLRAAKGYKAVAAAFARYRASLTQIVARLDALDAPPVLRPVVAGDRRLVANVVALCRRAEAALAAHRAAQADAAVRAVFAANTAAEARRTQAAQLAAARAYNARLKEIAALADTVARERLRLVKTTG
ncbi:MAG: hypothetical protein ACXVZ4_06295 [Gaiellaceae bacterium]